MPVTATVRPEHQSLSAPQSAVSSPQRNSINAQKASDSLQRRSISPQRTPVSPQKAPVSPQIAPVSPQKAPVSPQKAPVSPQKAPVSPVKLPVTPQRIPVSPHKEEASQQSAPVSPARSSLTQEATAAGTESSGGGGGVVVVVNGGLPSSSPRAKSPSHPRVSTTTIPIGECGTDEQATQQLPRKVTTTATTPKKARSRSPAGSTVSEGKKPTHEKSKSVTIVVNDQQVSYSSPGNGVVNGGLHQDAAPGDSTRPSSAASLQPGAKVDPDMQVRPLVGWWGGEGGSSGSVLEDTASSDDCHRSTLTLVHSPARTYLSGEAGEAVAGEDTGEAWGGGVAGLCGIALVLGAAVWLRLPGLLYEFGAGSFLAAWCGAVVVVAAPLALLEASLAQFSSSAAIALWRLVPIARGVGWSTVVVCVYWAAVVLGSIAPILHYLLLSLNPTLLWGVVGSGCDATPVNHSSAGDWVLHYHRTCVYQLPEDWRGGLLLTFSWPLPSCMAAAALLATIMGVCGARTLAGLLAGAATLAITGLSLQVALSVVEVLRQDETALWEMARPFLTPHPHTLLQPRVWCAAVAQVLLSLGLGVGLLMSFSSRAAFRYSLRRHLCGLLVLVVVVTTVVAFLSVMQLTLLASDRNTTLDRALDHHRLGVNETAVGMAGVGVSVSTAVITATHLVNLVTFPFPWLKQAVSTLIYIGLWCSGLTTITACVHTLVMSLRDTWDSLPRVPAALLVIPVVVAAAVPTTTAGGAGALALLDRDVLALAVLWPPFTLTLAITAIYGIHKVRKDFTFMLEHAVGWLWAPVWGVLLPLTLLGVVVWLSVIEPGLVVASEGPGWRLVAVWGLRVLVLLPVPITAIYVVKSQLAYGVVDKVASSLQSSREWGDWGPQDPIEHHNWRRWREDETRPIASLKRRLASRPLTYTHSTLSSESSSTLTRLRNKYQRNGTASVL